MVFGDAVAASHLDQGPGVQQLLDAAGNAVGLQELFVYPVGGTEGQHEGFHFLVFHAQGFLRVAVAIQGGFVPAAAAAAEGVGGRAQAHIGALCTAS